MDMFGSGQTSGVTLQDILAQLGAASPAMQAAPETLDGMASGQDGLAQLIANLRGSAAPSADQSVSAPATDTSTNPPNSLYGPSGQVPPLPDSYFDGLKSAGSGTTAPADPMAGLPTPPKYTPMNPVLGVLDQLFLGGAVRGVQGANFNQQEKAYNLALAQAEYRRAANFAAAQQGTPDAGIAGVDPMGFLKIAEDRATPRVLKGGESTDLGNGQMRTAPLLGNDNGRFYTQTPDATTITGSSGPSVLPNGVDSRSGRQFPIASTPVVPVGSAPWNVVTPGDATPGGPTAASVIAAAGQSGAQPALPAVQARSSAPLSSMTVNGKLDPVAFYKAFVFPHEGGLNKADLNGSPTMYGFNQAANPDIDVTTLTPAAAAQRFATNYYGPSGAGNLSPALAAIHADTSFINPSVANRFLRRSGGDPASYMAQREQWMANMVQSNPAARKYANAWAQRNADLSQLAGLSGAPTPDPGADNGFSGGSATPLGTPRGVTQNADGTQTSPIGEVTAAPNFLSPNQRMDAVAKFQDIPSVKDYNTKVDTLNALYAAMPKMTNNNGIIGAAAFGAQTRGVSGGVERPATVKIMTEQLPFSQDVASFIQNKFGADSKVTPEMFNQILAYSRSAAQTAQSQAMRVLRAQEAQVPKGQAPLGLSLEPIGDAPVVPWLNPTAGVNAQPQADALRAEMMRRGLLK